MKRPRDLNYADMPPIPLRRWAYHGLMFRLYVMGFLPTRALHRFSWRTFTPLFWKHWQPSRILRRRW
jgi:hypothetical protein